MGFDDVASVIESGERHGNGWGTIFSCSFARSAIAVMC